MSRSKGEPSARVYHAAVGSRYNMFLWAGDSHHEYSVTSTVVETFDVLSTSWRQPLQLRGRPPLPDGLRNKAVTTDEERAYFFGGYVGPSGSGERQNCLFSLDLSSLSCGMLTPTTAEGYPTPRAGSAMVHYKRKLVVYGGWITNATDDLLVFDLDTSEANIHIMYM